MTFLVGKTQERSNVSGQTSELHNEIIKWIQAQGLSSLNPGTMVDPAAAEPYKKQFADQNAEVFGQAKESAGNLTGSGLGNTLGKSAQRASTEQGSFLANLFENRRQNDAARMLQLVLGTMNSQAAGVQYTHKPGLLDYASQAAEAAAPFFAPSVAAKPSAAPSPGGQLGQASNYSFPSTIAPPDGTGSYWKGFGPNRDSFGTPR